MAAPALPLRYPAAPRRRPPRDPRWPSAAAGVALTALLVALMGSGLAGVETLGRLTGATPRPMATPERMTWVDVPPAPLPEPERAAPERAAPAPPLPAAPARPQLAAPALPAPTAPPAVRDSTVAAGRGAPALPGRVPAARLPAGPRLPAPAAPAAPTAAPTCVGPCLGGATGAVRSPAPPLDSAERADRLRELGRSVPAMAQDGGRSGGPRRDPWDTGPAPMGGVSIGVGFLGGGPSAEERRRTRALDAEVSAGLARVRARVDSIARADSLRADSLRRARNRPPG